MRFTGMMALVVVLLLCGIGCEVWRYRECRKVGHGALYCWGKALDSK